MKSPKASQNDTDVADNELDMQQQILIILQEKCCRESRLNQTVSLPPSSNLAVKWGKPRFLHRRSFLLRLLV